MISFGKQRGLGIFLVGTFSAGLLVLNSDYAPRIHRLSFISGWALFALMLVLAAYNGRKKLPFLPLGGSEGWLQFHIYAGLVTITLFAIHISFRAPSGWFESSLAWLYLGVTASGIFGLFVSRALPKRLTTRGGEVPFDRIPAIRRSLLEQAEALALQSIPQAKSSTIADFYIRDLKGFLDGPRNFWPHLFEVRSPLQTLLNKINDLNRFLNEDERVIMEKIANLLRQKDGLDYQRSLQLTLKVWLFAHIPLTYSLLLFSFVHIVLVYAFSGGAR
jgi:hypothetical protein